MLSFRLDGKCSLPTGVQLLSLQFLDEVYYKEIDNQVHERKHKYKCT